MIQASVWRGSRSKNGKPHKTLGGREEGKGTCGTGQCICVERPWRCGLVTSFGLRSKMEICCSSKPSAEAERFVSTLMSQLGLEPGPGSAAVAGCAAVHPLWSAEAEKPTRSCGLQPRTPLTQAVECGQ